MINTGVGPSYRPQTFHVFTYSFATGTTVPLPLRIALVGAKLTAGATATANTIYEVVDPVQTDTLFGLQSELAIMCRKAMETGSRLGQGPRLYAVPLAESGGVANVQLLTVTGPATASGTLTIRVSGRTFTIGVTSGDSQNTIASAISTAMKQNAQNLPVLVSAATNVVTLTHPTKGVNGIDVKVSVDQTVAGVVVTPSTSVTGTLATDHQPALDALAAIPIDAIVFANHATTDITEVSTDLASRWSPAEKRFRWYFFGEPGSIGTATTLATAANHQAVVIANMNGCLNTAGEMATALAVAAFSRNRPNANYDGLQLPLYPPAAASLYMPTQVEAAIGAGLTPLNGVVDDFSKSVVDGVAKIERMITTKTTDAGFPFLALKDFAVGRTGVYFSQQLDVAYAQRWSGQASPDGTLMTDDLIEQVKDFIRKMMRELASNNILRNVESDIALLRVEPDITTSGRLNVDISYTVVVGLHQIAFVHRVKV